MRSTFLIAALGVGLAACGGDDDVGSNIGEGAASYEVTFQATWSAATHPVDFPGNPHFSGLIGAVHGDRVSFWAEGQTASAGIRSMAETGKKAPLDGEVAASIDAGTGGALLSGDGIGTSPGFSSSSPLIPSLKARMPLPISPAILLIRPTPNSTITITRMMINSVGPKLGMIRLLQIYDSIGVFPHEVDRFLPDIQDCT